MSQRLHWAPSMKGNWYSGSWCSVLLLLLVLQTRKVFSNVTTQMAAGWTKIENFAAKNPNDGATTKFGVATLLLLLLSRVRTGKEEPCSFWTQAHANDRGMERCFLAPRVVYSPETNLVSLSHKIFTRLTLDAAFKDTGSYQQVDLKSMSIRMVHCSGCFIRSSRQIAQSLHEMLNNDGYPDDIQSPIFFFHHKDR
jgi:hypothetical protein